MKFVIPKYEEQLEIAGYLSKVDNLITLHQCEYFLCSYKNVYLHLQQSINKITNSWEQRKLGEMVNEVTRTDPESNAPIMMITANNGFIEQSDRYAFDNAGESLKKYILLEKGELAYNHGASKLRPYGSCFALTTVEKARIPFVYHCFSAKNQNSEFLSIELNSDNVEKQLRRIVSSGARMDGLLNISFTEYSTVELSLPKTEEQDKISYCFRMFDNLITLHQCEYFLCSYKYVYLHLQQSISKKTNSWEQRKLKSMTSVITKGTTPLDKSNTGNVNFIKIENINNFSGEISITQRISAVEHEGYLRRSELKENDILFSIAGTLGRVTAIKASILPANTNQAVAIIRLKEGVLNYIKTFLKGKAVVDFIRKNPTVGAQPNLSLEQVGALEIQVPDIQEQTAIGDFFEQLDNLITLHQRKLKDFYGGFL